MSQYHQFMVIFGDYCSPLVMFQCHQLTARQALFNGCFAHRWYDIFTPKIISNVVTIKKYSDIKQPSSKTRRNTSWPCVIKCYVIELSDGSRILPGSYLIQKLLRQNEKQKKLMAVIQQVKI